MPISVEAGGADADTRSGARPVVSVAVSGDRYLNWVPGSGRFRLYIVSTLRCTAEM